MKFVSSYHFCFLQIELKISDDLPDSWKGKIQNGSGRCFRDWKGIGRNPLLRSIAGNLGEELYRYLS